MIALRPYQQKAIRDLYKWFEHNNGNPVLNLPTGAGKSVIIAEICKDALQNWPNTRILMVTHTRELIAQNAEKVRAHWPNAPLGIYSAGMGRKEIEPITFAGIQSIRGKADELGYIDLMIADEAHLIGHKEEGGYRLLIRDLQNINPQMRVIGLTASPFRLGHGLITEKPAIFDDIIEPVSIEELQYQGYLSKLVSKVTKTHLRTEGVHKRGGDYIESELQRAVDTNDQNTRVVDEVLSIAGDRRHWLFFCTGIAHAEHVRDVLRSRGVQAEAVTGKTAKHERDSILDGFKRGNIKAVTNANILTTGFDFPDIDLIVMMRPTMSPGLYLQQAGRGLRLKSHTDHCLVLDFAGVVEQHGPITAVKIPRKNGEGDGIAPSKICPNCDSIIAAGCRVCPDCEYEYPVEEKTLDLHLRDVDIMGKEAMRLECGGWFWQLHTGKTSGKQMLMVEYMGVNISDRSIREYILIFHDGYPGYKAAETMKAICTNAGVDWSKHENTGTLLADLNYNGKPPSEVFYRKDGKFFKVVERNWSNLDV